MDEALFPEEHRIATWTSIAVYGIEAGIELLINVVPGAPYFVFVTLIPNLYQKRSYGIAQKRAWVVHRKGGTVRNSIRSMLLWRVPKADGGLGPSSLQIRCWVHVPWCGN